MFFYLYSDVNISCYDVWILITFSSKDVVMLIWTSSFNSNFKLFLNFFHFFSFAIFASVLLFHDLALTLAVRTFLR